MMRIFFRIILIAILTIFSFFFAILTIFNKRCVVFHPYIYKGFCHAFGIKTVQIIGDLPKQPCFVTANHISYTDIAVIGGAFPCQFVAKSSVKNWPIWGWIAHHLGTVFISRKIHDSKTYVATIKKALSKGKTLVLFPEGTTGDGCRLLPIKSSCFQLPPDTLIQPISLKYTHVNGLPASRLFQKTFSWRGSKTFIMHAKDILKIPHITACVMLHTPFYASKDRKKSSKICAHHIQKGFELL
jgi:1-acyl-sn-glycerol-3-phosphate acyltransferase